MFTLSSLFNVHASLPYVIIGQMSDLISFAYSLLLIDLLFQSARNFPSRSVACDSRLFTSKSHLASLLNIAPRYLKEFTSRRDTPFSYTLAESPSLSQLM